MARYYDKIGYGLPGELVNGVWTNSITERAYYGDILEETSSLDESDKVNPNVRLQHRISIVADAYALDNFFNIKYATWMGSLWTVNSVRVERPRLVLSLGGVYDGPRPIVVPDAP